ncbi:hypothetical protein IFM89_012081 [Coptis chinensis]|uniref:AT-hook motif nuclear-localized protein n=1 Tax=Coptis chinensis TaxID=261450 RepID=A0A835I2Q2_9MAGN|nr:hypothetical protein IFM89_012081 [Coptis chinensis]
MDGDESGLSSYYHHQQQQHQHQHQHQHHQQHHHPSTTTPPPPTTTSNTNGVIFSDPHHHHQQQQLHHHQHNQSTSHHYTSSEPTLVFPQNTVTGTLPPQPVQQQQETVKRKRGRPRKYGTPETPQTTSTTAAAATTTSATAKKLSTPSPSPSQTLPSSSSSPRRKDTASISSQSSSKKNQLNALGNAGQNFVSHVITVAAGEDVAQKIMSFTQQRKRAVCILSASGSISNASLRQPATLGGNVTYEGRFEILSLSGSFLHNETDGASSRTGGLSVCLSGTDGKIIGGGVGGPLKAAGPVQVIIGSFVIDTNKETNVDQKFEISSSKLPPQSRGMHSMPSTDWRDSPSFTDQGACQSSEDGDDGHLQH